MPKIVGAHAQADQVDPGPVAAGEAAGRGAEARVLRPRSPRTRSKAPRRRRQGTTTLVSPQCETPFGVVAALDSPYTSNATPAVAVTAPGRSKRRG